MTEQSPDTPACRTAQRAPHGLSFSIDELNRIIQWTERSSSHLRIVLDQVVDGVEFEELLVLTEQSARRRSVTLWRTASSVIVQEPHRRPNAFRSVADALGSIRVKPHSRSPRWWF